MYLDITVCPECGKELDTHTVRCHHCNQSISEVVWKKVLCWHWLDRFFLLSLAVIVACFFMPWFSGTFLYQDSPPFSAYTMLTMLVDIEIDFLDSYNILRMVQMVPLFSILIFFLLFLESKLKSSPFPGIFLFITLLSGGGMRIIKSLSGVIAIVAIIIYTLFIFYFYYKTFKTGTIGRLTHYILLSFLSISILIYLLDIYASFYAVSHAVGLLDTWGFWVTLVLSFLMTVMILLKNMRQSGDFWLTLFIILFSVVAYSALVKPLFFTETFIYFADNIHEIVNQLSVHVEIVAIAQVIAIAVGVPLGIYITRNPGVASVVLYVSSILITIPSIAMFGFMMPVLSSIDNAWDAVSGIGIGVVPAVVALSLYSLLPIVRNTYIALKSVDPATIEAGRGMGMTGFQLLIQLQLPLSAPIIMAGVRTAVVMGIAIAAIAAYIGAGGLGVFVSEGLQMSTNASVIAGALVMSLLAITADIFLGKAEDWLTPDGLKIQQGNE